MHYQTLNRQDLLDILTGCAVLGTGGGGDIKEGIAYIDYALSQNKQFRLISIDEAPQNEYVCTPYLLGALVDHEGDLLSKLQSEPLPMSIAFERLKKYSSIEFFGTICCEMGGANTAISMMLAALNDGFIIDADPTGRAVPEITHSTYYLHGLPAAPIVSANTKGEVFICEHIADDQRAEDVMRALCQLSNDTISVIDHAMAISDIKHAVIKGTVSKAWQIGKSLRLAAVHDGMPQIKSNLEKLAIAHGGRVIFTGKVKGSHFCEENGFTVGEVNISGDELYAGHTLQIQVKNENMAALLDGNVYATIPDLICCFDLSNQQPICNPHVHIDDTVLVMLLPAPTEFLSKRGLEIFGPKYAGFDTEFSSILLNDMDAGSGI